MTQFSNSKYQQMLQDVYTETSISNITIKEKEKEKVEVKQDEKLDELLDGLGITRDKGDFKLILHNDDVNDMMDVVVALYEICHLSNNEALHIMMEAHTKGKALAKKGSEKEMLTMKQGLNDRGIEATVEN